MGEPSDVVDDVNALLKMGVGDQYRLEHIKLAYIENKTLWESDKKYIERMREKYLARLHIEEKIDADENLDVDADNAHTIHCWKCGKKNLLKANFCMGCGTALYDIGPKPQHDAPQTASQPRDKARRKRFGIKKILVLIVIPVVVLAMLGAGYGQGYLDGVFAGYDMSIGDVDESKAGETRAPTPGESNSKCGPGTVFDPKTNACVLGSGLADEPKKTTPGESNSKCGPGTVFDPKANACVLGSGLADDAKTTPGESNSKCGPGTVLDPKTNACVLDS